MSIIKSYLIIFFLIINFPVMAEKIIINANPITLESHNDFYTIAANAIPRALYNYVNLERKHKVCYLDKQPNLIDLPLVTINVSISDKITPWHCYSFDDSVFEVVQSTN